MRTEAYHGITYTWESINCDSTHVKYIFRNWHHILNSTNWSLEVKDSKQNRHMTINITACMLFFVLYITLDILFHYNKECQSENYKHYRFN